MIAIISHQSGTSLSGHAISQGQISHFGKAVVSRWSEKKMNKDNFLHMKLVLFPQGILGNSTGSSLCSVPRHYFVARHPVVIQVCLCLLLMYWAPELRKEGVSYCADIFNSVLRHSLSSDCCISSNIYIYYAGNIFISSENPLSLQCFNS